MRLPIATPKTKPLSFFTHICWKLPAGFSWLCFPVECCDWCCFWSGFYLYIYICLLFVSSPWTLSSPGPLWSGGSLGNSSQSQIVSPALILATSFPATSNLPEEPYKLQMLSEGTCWGRKRKWSLPIEWSLGRMVKGRLGYTTEKHAVKSGCQEVLTGSYFGFWFWNCCAKSATDSLGRCLLMPGDHKPNHGSLKPPPWDCFKEK